MVSKTFPRERCAMKAVDKQEQVTSPSKHLHLCECRPQEGTKTRNESLRQTTESRSMMSTLGKLSGWMVLNDVVDDAVVLDGHTLHFQLANG
ncbi:hypothetical protein ACOMHN_051669 [Nucella lapillus]